MHNCFSVYHIVLLSLAERSAATEADETASVGSRATAINFPQSTSPNRAAGSPVSTVAATAAPRRSGIAESVTSSSKRAGRQAGRGVAVKGCSDRAASVAAMEPADGVKQPGGGFGVKEMDQLIRAFTMLSQVGCG